MNEYVKIKDESDLVKDKNTGAVLNTNLDSLKAYREKRKKDLEMGNKIDQLENDIGDIKSMLIELLNKG